MKPLVIYHANCRDGFCAAWCASQHFGAGAEYLPAHYGTKPPDVYGRDVYILDFSYPRQELEAMAQQAAGLVILDHHASAQAALEGFQEEMQKRGENVICVFDMEQSGAGLASAYFADVSAPYFGPDISENVTPKIVLYVEDRDLWKWSLPNSREINAWIASLPFDFAAWTRASELLQHDPQRVIELGQIAVAKTRTYCAEVATNVRLVTFMEREGVPCLNVPQVDIYEVLELLLDTFGGPFVLGWWLRADGLVQVSLRSRGDFDVSEIAKQCGGGGHKNAAGFQVSLSLWSSVATS